MNNLPKDYIRMCLTCRSLAEWLNRSCGTSRIHLFDFINMSDHIAKKIFDFLLRFKGSRDFNIGGTQIFQKL